MPLVIGNSIWSIKIVILLHSVYQIWRLYVILIHFIQNLQVVLHLSITILNESKIISIIKLIFYWNSCKCDRPQVWFSSGIFFLQTLIWLAFVYTKHSVWFIISMFVVTSQSYLISWKWQQFVMTHVHVFNWFVSGFSLFAVLIFNY